MSIMPIGPGLPVAPVMGPLATSPAASAGGTTFGAALADGLGSLQAMQATSEDLAVKAVTGDLQDVHDYTIAASQAAVATELTVAVRNKAVEAFNEILRMPL